MPDNSAAGKNTGVWRLTFDPATQTITSAVVLAPTAGLGGSIPTAAALGPDGKLYVGFKKSGDIKRITSPSGTSQTVEAFGKSSDGRGVSGLTFAGSNLYLAEGEAVTMIGSSDRTAVKTPISATAPTAIASTIDSTGNYWIYVADTPQVNSNILRYEVSTNTEDMYANTGVLPDGTTKPFQFVSGLSIDPQIRLFIGDDPTDGVQVLHGHIWTVTGIFDEYAEGSISGFRAGAVPQLTLGPTPLIKGSEIRAYSAVVSRSRVLYLFSYEFNTSTSLFVLINQIYQIL